jgi:prepilin-type N-terminal cleavage/methylation domain-containing protein
MRRQKAMTLIEVIVASGILGSMMVVVLSFTVTLTDSATEQRRATTIVQAGSRAVESIADSLRAANVNWGDSIPQFVAFQVPVDPDGTGFLNTDSDGNILSIRWGIRSRDPDTGEYSANLDHYGAFRFVAGTAPDGNPLIFDEGGRGYDLNRDGDEDDVFEIGHILKEYYDSTDYTLAYGHERLTGDVVVQLQGDPLADFVGGDGIPERMFSRPSTTSVGVTLVVTDLQAKFPALQKLSTVVEMQNSL